MHAKLEAIAHQLQQARNPEDVFGYFHERSEDCQPALKDKYHALAKIVHPDYYPAADEKILANLALSQLNHWFRQALEKSKSGLYGQDPEKPALVALQTRERLYWVEPDFSQDAMFNYHACRFNQDGRTRLAQLKIVRDPHDNEFAQNEAAALKSLSQHAAHEPGLQAYFPSLLDGFVYQADTAEHHALVFERYTGWYSLADVRQTYPAGIDPKDMAWVWRRLLSALGFAHKHTWLHNAVLPANIWIQPEQHGLMLTNWSYAGTSPGASSPPTAQAGWVPPEVRMGEPLSPAVDIVMSAKCMLFLLGGDPVNWLYPKTIPGPLKAFFRGTLLPAKRAPQDAWALKAEFDDLIEGLWGQRKFHPFTMK